MDVEFTDDGIFHLRGVNPILFDFLKDIVRCGASLDPRVEARFYPSPVEGTSDSEISEDWKAFVHPELYAHFLQAREVVQMDLKSATEDGGGCTVQIPGRHADAWISALNQARLSLAEENRFTEKELAVTLPPAVLNAREMVLLQMNFYAFLQEWLVQVVS